MSTELRLPDMFKGSWEHLLILTYGADLPFFENALLRSDFRCKNKVILADGQKFLQACERYARDGLVRMLNQHYVADGLYVSHAAHAKIILLTRPDAGKLLVGSGNLGAQGYTSGGEMFTLCEYNDQNHDTLPAFQAVWEMVDALLARGAVGGAVERYVRALYDGTPWLMHISSVDERPVRHNLEHSFLEQLQAELAGETVQELWVLSPFLDEKAVALTRLIETFTPQTTHLLLQSRFFSGERAAITKLMEQYAGQLEVHPFTNNIGNAEVYTHAKFYLLKTADRAICLQGSPNCSQVALLLASPQGNVEAANLLTGPREAFDGLLDNLSIQPALASLDGLEFGYARPEPAAHPIDLPWLLTGVQWQGHEQILHFHANLPALKDAKLRIGQVVVDLTAAQVEGRTIRVAISPELSSILGETLPPVVLETSTLTSSRIFPQHVELLEREAQLAAAEFPERSLKNLDPEDPEIEALFRELEATLPLDRRSIWQLAGRTPQVETEDSDEAYRLDYAEVDYERLRQHPRILQYSQGKGSAANPGQTRLQLILSAISEHFHGLADLAYGRQPAQVLPVTDDPEIENEQVEEPTALRPPVSRRRMRGILKNFIQRYLRGLQSADFLELVGPEVVTGNTIIFSYILWRLLQKKDWLEPDFVMQAFLEMARFYWGAETRPGYFSKLGDEARQRALNGLADRKTPGLLLAMLFTANFECMKNSWEPLRLAWRDFWRHILSSLPFELDAYLLSDAWTYMQEAMPYNVPTPGRMAGDLQALAKVEMQAYFLRSLEQRFGWPESCCRVTRETVFVEGLNNKASVECLRDRLKTGQRGKSRANLGDDQINSNLPDRPQ